MTPLSEQRIIPLAVPETPAEVDALGTGLSAGGIGAVEIGLRHPAALDAVRGLAADGRLLVGAGTVRSAAQADAAALAGAAFLVSPGLSADVVRRAAELDLPLIPGVASASDIMRAVDLGVRVVKLFPAHLLGGLAALDAFHAVFPDVRFVPSGGVSQDTLAEYLAHPAVAAVSGSWITSERVLAGGAAAVAAAARRAAATVDEAAR